MPRPYYSKDARVERSLRHSVRDGVSYSMMAGAGETYLSAYALFLKASTAQISLLTALPSLLGSLAQVLSAWLAGFAPRPFFTVYMLRDLHFTYLQYTASTGISVLAQFLTLNMWGRFGDIFGHRRVLALTGSLIPILPALWLVSPEFWYILGVQTLGGLCWAGFSLSAGNFLYDVMPPDKRATYAAIHNVLSNSAIFSGALVGGYLSTVIPTEIIIFGYTMHWTSGLWGVILISTLARATVALIFLRRIREVREVRPVSAGGLMIRVIRFNALAELVIDLLGSRRRRRRTRLLDSNQAAGPG